MQKKVWQNMQFHIRQSIQLIAASQSNSTMAAGESSLKKLRSPMSARVALIVSLSATITDTDSNNGGSPFSWKYILIFICNMAKATK